MATKYSSASAAIAARNAANAASATPPTSASQAIAQGYKQSAQPSTPAPGTGASVTPSGKGVLTSTGQFIPFSGGATATAGMGASVTPSGKGVLTSSGEFIEFDKGGTSATTTNTLGKTTVRPTTPVEAVKAKTLSSQTTSSPVVTNTLQSKTATGATSVTVPPSVIPKEEKPQDINAGKKTTKQLIQEANAQGLTGKAKQDYILAGRSASGLSTTMISPTIKESTTTPTAPTTIAPVDTTKSLLEQEKAIDAEKQAKAKEMYDKEIANQMSDEETLKKTLSDNQLTSDKYYADLEAEATAFQTQYENEKNKLLSDYESSRLNQVRGQIYQTLAARGVDLSKLPQEQLIALSGQVGATAFNDIFQAKEKVKTDILNAAKAKMERLQALRNEKRINDSQYNERLQSIVSTAKANRLNVDKDFANTIFGLQDTGIAKAKTQQESVTNTLSNIASTQLKLKPTQLALLDKFQSFSGTPSELVQAISREVADKNSELSKALVKNQEEANEAAQEELNAKYYAKYANASSIAQLKAQTGIDIAELNNKSDEQIARERNISAAEVASIRSQATILAAKERSQTPINVWGANGGQWSTTGTPSGGASSTAAWGQ